MSWGRAERNVRRSADPWPSPFRQLHVCSSRRGVRMVGIKEVAEAAGVSTATVSRVLSNGLHVRPEVRTRVMAAVERLGYRPNLVARSLRSQQSNTLGLIVSFIRNPFFTSIVPSVEDVAYEQGFI